ncbi:hypothetical protein AURDEDRAFT_164522 [Auricularia subglabra TFB-10046 SS5]|nr:hypothetical protein AURDEDRAFT_164522 [Auricularia subglabra TFB-10046 SS5]
MNGTYPGPALPPALYHGPSSSSALPTDPDFAGWPPSGGFGCLNGFGAAPSSAQPGPTHGAASHASAQSGPSLPSGSSGGLDVNELAGQLLRAIKERDTLRGELNESRRFCTELTELISKLKAVVDLGPPLRPSPKQSDYVQVKNWNAADHTDTPKKPYLFLVDSQGRWVGKPRVSYAIQVGKTILQELHRLGMLAGFWKKCGIRAMNLFINALEQAIIEFTYCGDHWKADKFASLIFREWKRRRGKELKDTSNGKRKRKGNTDDDDDEDSSANEDMDDEDDDKLSDDDPQPKKKRCLSEPVPPVPARLPRSVSAAPPSRPEPDAASRPPASTRRPDLAVPPPPPPPPLGARNDPHPGTPAAGARPPAVRFVAAQDSRPAPTAEQLSTARSVLQNQRAKFVMPTSNSGIATTGSSSIRGLRLPGQEDTPEQEEDATQRDGASADPVDRPEAAAEELGARKAASKMPSGPVAKPKGTHDFPLRKKSPSPEMHVRVAWALRTPPDQFSKANFEAYLQTPAGQAELASMKIRVKTCQDTGLDDA